MWCNPGANGSQKTREVPQLQFINQVVDIPCAVLLSTLVDMHVPQISKENHQSLHDGSSTGVTERVVEQALHVAFPLRLQVWSPVARMPTKSASHLSRASLDVDVDFPLFSLWAPPHGAWPGCCRDWPAFSVSIFFCNKRRWGMRWLRRRSMSWALASWRRRMRVARTWSRLMTWKWSGGCHESQWKRRSGSRRTTSNVREDVVDVVRQRRLWGRTWTNRAR